jgi:hypothetical protein
LFLKKNFDSICGPHRDARTEKIGVLGPNWTSQPECCCEYRPIAFVSTAQTLPGFAFKDRIEFGRDGLY